MRTATSSSAIAPTSSPRPRPSPTPARCTTRSRGRSPRPIARAIRSGREDFSPSWFNAFMFGDGVNFDYTRARTARVVNEDFTGKSVKKYFQDMSGGAVRHRRRRRSAGCKCRTPPGGTAPTSAPATARDELGGWPQTAASPVRAAPEAWSRTRWTPSTRSATPSPAFDWKNYDLDGDGVIDRLWIVHAGYGEEDGTDAAEPHGLRRSGRSGRTPPAVTPAYPVGAGHFRRPVHHDARERRHRRVRP